MLGAPNLRTRVLGSRAQAALAKRPEHGPGAKDRHRLTRRVLTPTCVVGSDLEHSLVRLDGLSRSLELAQAIRVVNAGIDLTHSAAVKNADPCRKDSCH